MNQVYEYKNNPLFIYSKAAFIIIFICIAYLRHLQSPPSWVLSAPVPLSAFQNIEFMILPSKILNSGFWLQNLEFSILDCQNPEFRILDCQNLEFRILAVQNLEFRIWRSKILNSGFWSSKILNSAFCHSKILNSRFCNSNSTLYNSMKMTLTVALPQSKVK